MDIVVLKNPLMLRNVLYLMWECIGLRVSCSTFVAGEDQLL